MKDHFVHGVYELPLRSGLNQVFVFHSIDGGDTSAWARVVNEQWNATRVVVIIITHARRHCTTLPDSP